MKSCRKVAEQLVAKPNREPVTCKLLCYSVLSRENLTIPIKILYIVCFEAVARGLNDVSNDLLKCVVFTVGY